MKRPYGITFEIGRADSGWFFYLGKLKLRKMRPSLDGLDATFGGFKLDINIGTLRRPVPRFWKKEFWSTDYMTQEPVTNPWNSGNHWFVFTIPFFLGVFLSVSVGAGERQPGFYLGCKTYEVNEISQGLGRYDVGNPETGLQKHPYPEVLAWGTLEDVGNIYLCPSASIRDDLVD